jgi:hypothetical protein
MPYFLKKAVESKDPVEKMKYVMSGVFSGFYYLNLFLKPVQICLSIVKPSHRRNSARILP